MKTKKIKYLHAFYEKTHKVNSITFSFTEELMLVIYKKHCLKFFNL